MNLSSSQRSPEEQARSYWKANLRLLTVLLLIWFLVSYGCGILFVDVLNQFHLPGTSFPLGFWFAQQGSIYAFLVLIFVYIKKMQQLDEHYGFSED